MSSDDVNTTPQPGDFTTARAGARPGQRWTVVCNIEHAGQLATVWWSDDAGYLGLSGVGSAPSAIEGRDAVPTVPPSARLAEFCEGVRAHLDACAELQRAVEVAR